MSLKPPFSWKSFKSFPAVGILRGFETNLVKEIGEVCFDAGLTSLEVTLNTKDVFEQIQLLRELAPDTVNIGAGTVISIEGLECALDAGANFIVSPVVDEKVIQACVDWEVPIFPGAYTPTEVLQAWNAGAKVIKLFPSNNGGPEYLKSVRAPLDHIPLMAVGSVNLHNLQDYIDAGVCAVGVGSPLFEKSRMESKDWCWLRKQIRSFKERMFGMNPIVY